MDIKSEINIFLLTFDRLREHVLYMQLKKTLKNSWHTKLSFLRVVSCLKWYNPCHSYLHSQHCMLTLLKTNNQYLKLTINVHHRLQVFVLIYHISDFPHGQVSVFITLNKKPFSFNKQKIKTRTHFKRVSKTRS